MVYTYAVYYSYFHSKANDLCAYALDVIERIYRAERTQGATGALLRRLVTRHSLCDNALTPFYGNRMLYDNCACRVKKGTLFDMKRLEGFMRERYKPHGHTYRLRVKPYRETVFTQKNEKESPCQSVWRRRLYPSRWQQC